MLRKSLVLALGLFLLAAVPALAAQVTFSHQAPGAGGVYLAGEFNGWSDSANPMTNTDGVWTLTLDLDPGSYQYKFVVDGSWVPDETNPNSTDDGFGGQNSLIEVPAGVDKLAAGSGAAVGSKPTALAVPGADAAKVAVTFTHEAEGAGAVYLAGEFNGWNDSANLMTENDGVWTLVMKLEPGDYAYKFVVDGSWTQDPLNPNGVEDGFGGQNSVVSVPAGAGAMAAAGGGAPVVAAAAAAPAAALPADGKVAVTFVHEAPGAGGVYLAGDFNGWSDSADLMDEKDGVWTKVLNLEPGDYGYKFVVDGSWTQDMTNPNATDDGFGGQNSVVHVPHGQAAIQASEGGGAAPAAAAPAAGTGEMRSVEFRYTPVISGVSNVFLAGTFNDWNDSKTRMNDSDGDGTYTVTLLLSEGEYQYKFVVDGNWKPDPNNPDGTDDGFGGQNSILRVDSSFATIEIELGDGRIYSDDLEPVFDYSTCNPVSPTEIAITAKAHVDDVEELKLIYMVEGQSDKSVVMKEVERDASFQYYRAMVKLNDPNSQLAYLVAYTDGGNTEYFGKNGMQDSKDTDRFVYVPSEFPAFFTPEWAKDGIVYQIFPERFNNGDKSNDPDFAHKMYDGARELPASGKTNGEYFHLVEDWYDYAGLKKSPYRTDGKPDYYSFYGGDIEGIRQKLDYLNDLGITVIYFNPLNHGMSNHKYDPVDYLKIDPAFGTADEFKQFVKECHERGIRIVVDVAFNHTGNWHFAFRDAVENGPQSPYYKWYEFHRWPLPKTRDFKAADYYDCWWGFGLHPNLNFDLTRSNANENNIDEVSKANPNMDVVNYVLKTADVWLGEFDIDGFRLDVPNEVPFWFWKLFRERCNEVKKEVWLVGEIWGNAGRWIGPNCFDSTMNYKFFRDPVMDFFGKGSIDAATFDSRLSPGRFQYPPQSVAVMMNLMDSHDTIRFLTSARDVRRLMLGAMFSMSYVGMPHIWYGNEVGMTGGKDPDCRRPMNWRYEGDPRKVALRDYYGQITRLRRDNKVLSRGSFTTLAAQGKTLVTARELDGKLAVSLFNAGGSSVVITLSQEELRELAGKDADLELKVMVGPEHFPRAAGASFKSGDKLNLKKGDVELTLPGMSGAMLLN
jgi:cyclomaltodextrinase